MTAPAIQTDSATAPSATPLEQDIGQMFGDYSTSGETPEPEESAAGTTPAEPAEGTEPEPASEPSETGADASDPPSEGTTPDAAPAAIEEDPWKDTTPAEVVVNGKSIPVEDIRVFKEGGAAIRPEALPNVLSKLAEREQLAERIQVRDRDYQTLAKATEWTDQSSGTTYTGPEAAIEMRIGNASLFAENQLLVQTITDPDALARCLTTEVGQDGRERVVFSPDALDSLRIRNENQQIKAAQAIRAHYTGVIAEASRPQPAPVNYEQAAPALVKQIATQANLDMALLSPEDHKVLAEQLPFHIKDGLASVAWQNLAKRMMTTAAAQKANASSIASTAVASAKKGQANMLAAARGVKPSVRPATPAPKAPTPAQERTQNEGDAFDALLTSGAAAMRGAR